MFPNKILRGGLSKLAKCKLESRVEAGLTFMAAKPLPQYISPNFSSLTPAENNGFQAGISPIRILPEIGNRRWMSKSSDAKCWSCKQALEIKNFSCGSCGALQYPKPNVNFFQLLGISQMYEVDLEELTKNFRNLQMVFHPDKFANKSKEEQEISETYSRLLNKACATLKDPVARGFYLLELRNVPKDTPPLQQDFLKTVMEKHEELDAIEKPSSLTQFMQSNNEEIEKQIKLVKEAFRSERIESARINLLKLNYFVTLDSKIKEKQNQINPQNDT